MCNTIEEYNLPYMSCDMRFPTMWPEIFFSSRAEILPHSQWNLGDFFPNFEERNPNLNFLTFFFEDWDFHSMTTYKLHVDNLHPLHLIWQKYVSLLICFFIDQK